MLSRIPPHRAFPAVFGRSAPIQWLLRDEFTTAAAAPLTSPRTCEPGPGTLTLTDTGNHLSIVGAALRVSGAPVVSWADPVAIDTLSRARIAGRAMFASVNLSTTTARAIPGWRSVNSGAVANVKQALYLETVPDFEWWNGAAQIALGVAWSAATVYPVAVVLRGTGAFGFVKLAGTWKLLWVDSADSNTPLYASLNTLGVAAQTIDEDYLRVRDLGGAFATDNGIATVNVAAASGVTQTADADGIYDLAFTLPAGSANLVAVELRYRYTDASNYWTAYIKRNAGNTAWDFFLDVTSAGTPTNQITVTGVGTPDTLRVVADATKHDCYTAAANVWAKRGAQITSATFQALTTVDPIAGAGTTLGALKCWARTSTLYGVLDAT